MNLLLAAVRGQFPEWNRRPHTFADFETACSRLGVLYQRAPVKTPGMYFECDGRPVITLSSRLVGVELWRVAWHEMAHHLLHAPGLRCFSRSMTDKSESEAEIASLGFVLDEPTFHRILRDGELHDFPMEMLNRRMTVAERFKF